MKDIIQALIENAQNHPDHKAIQHNNESLTYRELNQYSNILADIIKDSKRPLILYGHMSPFMIVGMLASIKAGCGYVPIDTSIPHERIQSIIEKIEGQFIFNTTENDINIKGINVIEQSMMTSALNMEQFDSRMVGENIAYTIFTSGSTGEPKGVQISYESLNQFTKWMVDLNKLGHKQQWLNQAPFSFDLSVMAVYPCITTAGTLNLVDKTMINKPKILNQMLEHSKINIWVSTPSFMEMCLMLPNLSETTYTSLKEFFFCGEILAHRTAQMLLQRFPSAYIYNTYGPTEATVAVTSILITEAVIERYNPLPVGVPRPGTSLSLTDKGELVISGKCVSAGYVKDEVRSNEVFKINNNKKYYYTGDKAEIRDDQWFINGRIDFQIKLNGYRMELEEIEFQLGQIACIKEAIVVPIYKGNKVIHLNAVIVVNEADRVENEQEAIHNIKYELKQRIPEYMIPRKVIFQDKLPLTVNGKLDRKKIAEDVM